jgi:hypothetical protein
MNIFMGYSCTEPDISRVKQTTKSSDFNRKMFYTNNFMVLVVFLLSINISQHTKHRALIPSAVTPVVMVAVGGIAGKGRKQRLPVGSK